MCCRRMEALRGRCKRSREGRGAKLQRHKWTGCGAGLEGRQRHSRVAVRRLQQRRRRQRNAMAARNSGSRRGASGSVSKQRGDGEFSRGHALLSVRVVCSGSRRRVQKTSGEDAAARAAGGRWGGRYQARRDRRRAADQHGDARRRRERSCERRWVVLDGAATAVGRARVRADVLGRLVVSDLSHALALRSHAVLVHAALAIGAFGAKEALLWYVNALATQEPAAEATADRPLALAAAIPNEVIAVFVASALTRRQPSGTATLERNQTRYFGERAGDNLARAQTQEAGRQHGREASSPRLPRSRTEHA
jgi:hypothetical protein